MRMRPGGKGWRGFPNSLVRRRSSWRRGEDGIGRGAVAFRGREGGGAGSGCAGRRPMRKRVPIPGSSLGIRENAEVVRRCG